MFYNKSFLFKYFYKNYLKEKHSCVWFYFLESVFKHKYVWFDIHSKCFYNEIIIKEDY